MMLYMSPRSKKEFLEGRVLESQDSSDSASVSAEDHHRSDERLLGAEVFYFSSANAAYARCRRPDLFSSSPKLLVCPDVPKLKLDAVLVEYSRVATELQESCFTLLKTLELASLKKLYFSVSPNLIPGVTPNGAKPWGQMTNLIRYHLRSKGRGVRRST